MIPTDTLTLLKDELSKQDAPLAAAILVLIAEIQDMRKEMVDLKRGTVDYTGRMDDYARQLASVPDQY